MAKLSTPVERAAFEKSWHSDPALHVEPRVEFAFVGQTVSVVVHSDTTAQWPSASFHQTFSAAVRRLDPACNVRWL